MSIRSLLTLGFVVATAACGQPSVDVDAPLEVVHLSPNHGAIEVDRALTGLVGLSAPVDERSLGAITLVAAESDTKIELGRFLEDDGMVVAVVPAVLLEPNTRYRLTVGTGLASDDGRALLSPARTEFVTTD